MLKVLFGYYRNVWFDKAVKHPLNYNPNVKNRETIHDTTWYPTELPTFIIERLVYTQRLGVSVAIVIHNQLLVISLFQE